MSKYKVGDKVILTVTGMTERGGYQYYELNDNFNLWESSTDNYAEPLSTYTEPLEAKIRRQAAEITRLLEENKALKEDFEKSKRVNFNMGRVAGQNEAWELVRKIFDMETNDIEDIFIKEDAWNLGTVLNNYTYQEAAAKVAEWEKAKKEIKVGDIFQDNDGNNAIVTSIKGNTVYYMWDDGNTRSGFAEDVKKHFTKTGRHIDIDGFLKQIGRGRSE